MAGKSLLLEYHLSLKIYILIIILDVLFYLFTFYFMTLSIIQIIYRQMMGWLVNNELKRKWKRWWPNLCYYPGMCLGVLRKTTEKLSQDSQSPCWFFNAGRVEYQHELRVPTTWLRRGVISEWNNMWIFVNNSHKFSICFYDGYPNVSALSSFLWKSDFHKSVYERHVTGNNPIVYD
jgi:hypothetical protein